jgi:hypothetical protein
MVLGAAGRALSVRTESHSFAPGDVVLLFSDDLSSRARVEEPALLREPPIVIAEQLMDRYARGRDDALVAVVR